MQALITSDPADHPVLRDNELPVWRPLLSIVILCLLDVTLLFQEHEDSYTSECTTELRKAHKSGCHHPNTIFLEEK